jgi:hypothetical protein
MCRSALAFSLEEGQGRGSKGWWEKGYFNVNNIKINMKMLSENTILV